MSEPLDFWTSAAVIAARISCELGQLDEAIQNQDHEDLCRSYRELDSLVNGLRLDHEEAGGWAGAYRFFSTEAEAEAACEEIHAADPGSDAWYGWIYPNGKKVWIITTPIGRDEVIGYEQKYLREDGTIR